MNAHFVNILETFLIIYNTVEATQLTLQCEF